MREAYENYLQECKKATAERKEIQSQNHRIYEIGRDFWGSSNPSTCCEYSQLKQVLQGHVLLCFEYIQGQRQYNLSGKPVPVFNPLWKGFGLILNGIPCISVHPHFFLSYHCAWQRRVWFCLPNSLPCRNNNQLFIHMEKISLTFCFSRLNSSISLSMSSYIICPHPLIIFVVHPWTCSRMCTSLFFWLGNPGVDGVDMTHQVWAEVRDHLPQPAAIAFLNADHKLV